MDPFLGELSILGRELAEAWRARAANVVLPIEGVSQILEDGPGAGYLLDGYRQTLPSFRNGSMGQR